MKKLLLTFGLLLACVFSFSQIIQPKTTPNFQQFGTPQTWTQTNGFIYPVAGFVNSEYADTVSANLIPYVKNAPGVQIRIGDNIWLRSYDAKKWLLIPTQGIVVNGDSINYLVDVNRPPGQLNVYGKFFNGISAYSRLLYTDSIGSGGGSSYTFPYSVVAPGNAIQLENDTTANPANYFYGRNSAGRRGWYPQSGITGVNIYNSDGTLTGNRGIAAAGYDFYTTNVGFYQVDGDELTFEGGTQQFKLKDTSFFKNRVSYGSNLGSTFTKHSLIDKNYVDSLIASIGSGYLKYAAGGLYKNGDTVKLGGTLNEDVRISGISTYQLLIDSALFLVRGVHGEGKLISNYGEAQMFFSPRKSAFRAGKANGSQFDGIAVADYSAAFGFNSAASGQYSFAAGGNPVASASYAVAFGSNTISSGTASFVVGANSSVTGDYGSGLGNRLKSKHFAGLVIGNYNDSADATNPTGYDVDNRVFQIGIGTAEATRKNAQTVLFSGLHKFDQYTSGGSFVKNDTTNYKPAVFDASGNLYRMDGWKGSGGGGGSGITIGTTTITSGTNGRIGYNNSGVYGEKAVTGTGDVVLATSPTLVTPILGTPTSATLTNATGLPLTTGLTGGNWKTIYTNGSGTVTELALGSAGKVLTTNGTSSAPTWETPASGVTTMAAIGATPNANGATISGSTLNLQPVSASFGGVVTTSAQTLGAGIKTFSDNVIISNVSNPKLAITNGTQYTQIFTGSSLSIFQFPNSTKFGIQAATGASDNGTSGTYSAIFEGSSNNALFGGVAYNASITPSASLEVRSTTKGFLPPKMTGTQQAAISSPATGLMIYNTDSSAFTYYTGSAWVKIGSGGGGSGVTSIGTINSETKSANGAVISGSNLVMQTVDDTYPGLMTSALKLKLDSLYDGDVQDSVAYNTITGAGLYDSVYVYVYNFPDYVTYDSTLVALITKVTASSTTTFTNKTFDADGTGNSITNIENADIKSGAAIDATKIADGTVTSTEFQYINTLSSNVQTQINALPTASSTTTFTNKRWTARVGSTTSSATPTINTDNVDIYKITALSTAITSMTSGLSGTLADGDILEIQITDNGTARAITWGSSFVSSTVPLPTTTVISTTLTVILQYYTTSSYGNNKLVCVNYY